MSNDKESRAAKLTEEHQAQRILDVLHFPGYNKGVLQTIAWFRRQEDQEKSVAAAISQFNTGSSNSAQEVQSQLESVDNGETLYVS